MERMLVVASLLFLASSLMGLTTGYLALFTIALTGHSLLRLELLGSGMCAALGLMALWSETALGLVQIGILGGHKPAPEGHVAAGVGVAVACFFCLLGMPWASALVPLLSAGGCLVSVWGRRKSAREAVLSTLALMTDKGECRYLRGIILMILLAFLLRGMVA